MFPDQSGGQKPTGLMLMIFTAMSIICFVAKTGLPD
jgi:hypothetical protein